jgi:exodeoxyribonuclease VII small subunit
MAPKTNAAPHTLESAMQRIAEIVTTMETAELPLEKLIDAYEEGVGLVKNCQEKLDAADKRIQTITRNARGGISLEDFEASGN